jgi:peptide/nickel transport system substrate-binding protein
MLLGGRLAAALAAVVVAGAAADASTLRWARSGDALTLDPHAQNEGPTHTLNHQIYETLVLRHHDGSLMPGLALSWRVADDPSIWEFQLRPEVRFHDGTPFTADDVVFSLKRALTPTSDMKGMLASVDDVVKVDDDTVHVRTKGPNPILPENLTNVFIMSKAWAEANNSEAPQDFSRGEESYAARNANGTGAYRLVSREPGVTTRLERFEGYWGKDEYPLEVSEIVYSVIGSAPTRVAALLSGEIDLVQDMPVQDIERVASTAGLRVNTGPENRTIFLGLNVGDTELRYSDVRGANPFADRQVRQAMNMAIDREAIQKVVMADQAVPAGSIVPPFVGGYRPEFDDLPPRDIDKARALIAEAGYPDGFSVTLHCPNDRYLNDEKICQAVVGMLGQIGIRVALEARSKTLHFPEIQRDEVDFYLLGWGVQTYDSENILTFLYRTKGDRHGGWNGTRYSNPEIDAKIEALSEEADLDKRNAMIAEVWDELLPEAIYIAIHHQVLAWGMTDALDVPVHPDNALWVKEFSLAK